MNLHRLNALSLLLFSFIILLDFDGTLLINAQGDDGAVDETPSAPSAAPTAAPSTEFPKTLSFSMQLFMDNAQFDDKGEKGKTLGTFFQTTLCQCVFEFDNDEQCTEQKIQRSSPNPTTSPTTEPTWDPTTDPTTPPTTDPTLDPTSPTDEPTLDPTTDPTVFPTVSPTNPTVAPSVDPTVSPTLNPSVDPTVSPTLHPTVSPTVITAAPTTTPSVSPTNMPSVPPTLSPSRDPTLEPTMQPTLSPTEPTSEPTLNPSTAPTKSPSKNPTSSPSSNPSESPSSDPTVSPSSVPSNPSNAPSTSPSSEPTLEPTTEPTMEPTPNGGGRRLLSSRNDGDASAYDAMRNLLAANSTSSPSSSPVASPSSSPTKNPSVAPTVYTIYDLKLVFEIKVISRVQEDKVFDTITSNYFFNEFKQCLLDTLDIWEAQNETGSNWRAQILSMQEAPFSDIGILSPTYSPTSYPTYDYQAGEEYGYWMIGLGICIVVAVLLYWAYRRYAIHLDYKEEQKSAPQANVELQSLFENVTPAGDESYKD